MYMLFCMSNVYVYACIYTHIYSFLCLILLIVVSILKSSRLVQTTVLEKGGFTSWAITVKWLWHLGVCQVLMLGMGAHGRILLLRAGCCHQTQSLLLLVEMLPSIFYPVIIIHLILFVLGCALLCVSFGSLCSSVLA